MPPFLIYITLIILNYLKMFQIFIIFLHFPTKLLFPIYHKVFGFLEEEGIIFAFLSFNDTLLIALDGTWVF